jgi:hypothetical protein
VVQEFEAILPNRRNKKPTHWPKNSRAVFQPTVLCSLTFDRDPHCRTKFFGDLARSMQAIFVAWYNFARKNEALKNQTPAMASGLSDHVWTIKELIERAAA